MASRIAWYQINVDYGLEPRSLQSNYQSVREGQLNALKRADRTCLLLEMALV